MRRIMECIPNFSEGRDPARIDALQDAMSGIPGVRILDRQSDFDHNRCVFTLAGEPQALQTAALRGVAKAAELIDLTRHSGVHPRIGALDVLPFIPVSGVSMEDCVALARDTGRQIWERYRIPVYFYEAAAASPERVNLENIRRGEFEQLRDLCVSDPARKPDVGGPQLHPTAGAIAVGARKALIACNFNLSTPDAGIAKEIARAIRFSSGGLRYVKAIGLELKTRGQAQVSVNLTDYEQTPLHRVFEMVRREAQRHGCSVVETEIIGLLPRKAVEMAAAYFLQIAATGALPVLENRLEQALDEESTEAAGPTDTQAPARISISVKHKSY
jgi:glutamate formiminotransferase